MKPMIALMKRELMNYFYSPVAYVFIVIFLISTVGSTFFLGRFFNSDQAGLEIFFLFHPWLFLFLIPAIGMGLWAEERNSGTIELLFTLPISMLQTVMSKFLSAWIFVGIALILTFPMVITVWYLGEPDNGVMFTSYLGSFLMAGTYLAITCVTSALTRNQVISFILSVIVCLTLVLLGWGVFMDMLNQVFPSWFTDVVSSFSFTTHYNSIRRGIIDSRDLVFFLSIIGGGLVINALILDYKKAS
ncbi:MAG: ABC transporter permease [SAR324 cluster bacterium]|uniref:ABC transporter permease n=1 Tax=SAR324 cluster bacterium TaxID=2024889 RepID=A0A2A4T9V3_9DELT|nr:MAG: ABC transporter permease [SAR324 cluster bacterium]